MRKVFERYQIEKHEFLFQSLVGALMIVFVSFVMRWASVPPEYAVFTIAAMAIYKVAGDFPYLTLRDWRFSPQWLKNLLKEGNYRSKEGKKLKSKNFYDEVYGANVIFLYGGTHTEVDKYLSRMGFTENKPVSRSSMGFCRTGTVTFNEEAPTMPLYLIWVQDPRDYGVLVHEVLHLVFRILEQSGIKYSEESEESFAYYQKYWVERIWYFLTRGEEPSSQENTVRKEPVPALFRHIS